MYRVSRHRWTLRRTGECQHIRACEVIRKTEKTVSFFNAKWGKLQRELIDSSDCLWFEEFDEAREFLLRTIRREIEQALHKLGELRADLDEAERAAELSCPEHRQ